MKYRLKIVPKSDPNAEAEWVEIETQLRPGLRWAEIDELIAENIPETHFVVMVKMEDIK
jgi:hypothetical protein